MSTVTVAARFCGPPGVANGGWLAGRLAAEVGAGPVAARLRRPTPLDRPLDLRHDGAAVELLDGAELLARAEPADLDLDVPAAPAPRIAVAAALPPRTDHPVPDCSGCGPHRRPGDAVAALLGPLPDRPDVWAGGWRPTAELPSAGDEAAPEAVWAGLDRPSFQPLATGDGVPHAGSPSPAVDHRRVAARHAGSPRHPAMINYGGDDQTRRTARAAGSRSV